MLLRLEITIISTLRTLCEFPISTNMFNLITTEKQMIGHNNYIVFVKSFPVFITFFLNF